jgi:hypothetical protein
VVIEVDYGERSSECENFKSDIGEDKELRSTDFVIVSISEGQTVVCLALY